MIRILLVAALVALTGCAGPNRANFESDLATWTGRSEVDLLRAWGVPQRSHEVGDRKFVTFMQAISMTMPGVEPTYVANTYGRTTYVNSYGGMPAQNLRFYCETTFEIADGKVAGSRWQGNNCIK